MKVKTKAKRTIVGLVCKVEMACGCHAYVTHGGTAFFRKYWNTSDHVVVHNCKDWKLHKYELSQLERDLAIRMAKFRQKDFNATRYI